MRIEGWRGMTRIQKGGLVAGPVAFLLLSILDTPLKHLGVTGNRPAYAAGVALLMAIWWLTEAFPIAVTACVPLLLFPLTGVFGDSFLVNLRDTLLPYVDPYIFLFAGGMCIAAAMQQWDLHRRVALTIMRLIGTDPRRLLFGFIGATAFISLWISNTATATMMVPIGLAVIAQLERQLGVRRLEHYGMAIMLSIAYASNVGGIGTKIGTAPNAQFSGFMSGLGVEITFLQFMAVGIPFVLLFLPIVWYFLWRIGRRDQIGDSAGAEVVAHEIKELGTTKPEEKFVMGVFLAAATLWICGKPLTDTLAPEIPSWFKLVPAHIEATVAMVAALVLLLSRRGGRPILAVRSLRLVPWSTLLLLGGSFSMAAGVASSGLSGWMGGQLGVLRDLPPTVGLLLTALVTVGMSAVASNTATVNIMLNVLRSAVVPSMLNTTLFTATIAASCDFALPAGTPPNAIVFGSGYVTIPAMARTGVMLDLIAAVLAAFLCGLLVPLVLP